MYVTLSRFQSPFIALSKPGFIRRSRIHSFICSRRLCDPPPFVVVEGPNARCQPLWEHCPQLVRLGLSPGLCSSHAPCRDYLSFSLTWRSWRFFVRAMNFHCRPRETENGRRASHWSFVIQSPRNARIPRARSCTCVNLGITAKPCQDNGRSRVQGLEGLSCPTMRPSSEPFYSQYHSPPRMDSCIPRFLTLQRAGWHLNYRIPVLEGPMRTGIDRARW